MKPAATGKQMPAQGPSTQGAAAHQTDTSTTEPAGTAARATAPDATELPSSAKTAVQARDIPEAETPVAEEATVQRPAAAARDAEMPSPAARAPRGGAARGMVVALMVASFVLEVALLGAAGIWGLVMLPLGSAMSLIVTIVPLVLFWAVFMSPKASLRLPQPYHAVLAHLLFAAGAGLLAIAGQPVLAVGMGVLTAISLALTVAVRGQNAAGATKATGRRAAR